MARDFLLEIGMEEMPARFMPGTIERLKELAVKALAERRLGYSEITSTGTPRRLVLLVKGLEEKQEDQVEEVRGPSRRAAFDEAGKPTAAAEGFARSQGVPVDSLTVKDTPAGEYVFALKKVIGASTLDVLLELATGLILGLSFPRPMRWGYGQLRFGRPIRWLLALFGTEVVPFELEGLVSGRHTYGHRFLSRGPHEIREPGEYFECLREAYVIADHREREELIWRQVTELAAREGGYVERDEDLLQEINFLVEYPTPLCGTFAEEYLKLPEEVLVTPMRHHQRYFPVRAPGGGLLPRFIAVSNGTADYLDNVREGNEKVLRARLADASFFYEEDREVPLIDRLRKLQGMVFQEKLGTIYDKVERLERLAGIIAGLLDLDQDTRSLVQRAARLCKADLATRMVFEFPELQGAMGRQYARLSGEDEAVAGAIYEHYLPRYAGDELPVGIVGIVVGLADKMDTIVGSFTVGIQPTGSQDPYGLRRQAMGVITVLVERDLPLSLNRLIEEAYQGYGLDLPASRWQQVKEDIREFLLTRLRNLLSERDIRYDVIEAILSAGYDNVGETVKRARALAGFLAQPEAADVVAAHRRASTLASRAPREKVNPDRLAEPAEQQLYEAYLAVRGEALAHLEAGNYEGYLRSLARLRNPLDRFLDEVMVMVEDPVLRENRLALLREVSAVMGRAADFSRLVG